MNFKEKKDLCYKIENGDNQCMKEIFSIIKKYPFGDSKKAFIFNVNMIDQEDLYKIQRIVNEYENKGPVVERIFTKFDQDERTQRYFESIKIFKDVIRAPKK